MDCKKPPIGIKPRFIHDSDRMEEIIEAMERYSIAEIPIPVEWIVELKQLLKWYFKENFS